VTADAPALYPGAMDEPEAPALFDPADPEGGMLPLPRRALRVDQAYAATLGAIGPAMLGAFGGFVLAMTTAGGDAGLGASRALGAAVLGGLALLLSVVPLRVFVFAPLAWSRFRYRIDPEFLRIRSGLFVVRHKLIPLVRVQNVDSAQGPLERRFDLADIRVHNAAATHVIPNLDAAEAERLREHLAELVRQARDDA
jgi:membrane protein YdbS with pleckstrin-like domain